MAWKYLIIVSAGLALALLGIILFYWGARPTFVPMLIPVLTNFPLPLSDMGDILYTLMVALVSGHSTLSQIFLRCHNRI